MFPPCRYEYFPWDQSPWVSILPTRCLDFAYEHRKVTLLVHSACSVGAVIIGAAFPGLTTTTRVITGVVGGVNACLDMLIYAYVSGERPNNNRYMLIGPGYDV